MTITQYTLKDEKGNNVTVNKSSSDESWRMVHDGSTILSLHQATGFTETRNTLFLAATWDECMAESNRMGLSNVDVHVQERISDLLDASYLAMKQKGESALSFAATLLSKTTDPTKLVGDLTSVVASVAASRNITPVKIIKP